MWFLVLGAAILVAAVAVGLAMAFRGGGGEGVANGVEGACVRKTYPPMGRQHVEKLSPGFEYNSFPPSSGPHYPPGPKAPAVWNLYESPLDQVALVHNLEHGGIVVQYGPKVPKTAVDRIAAWYAESPNGMLVAPLPPANEMHAKAPPGWENKIFLTAWTHVATCSAFDENAFTSFRDDYRGKGPERFPVEALQPGGQ
jgi:Protein of unknown function (DUF3105)